MAKGGQLIPYVLPTFTWAAGGRASQPLKDIPAVVQGRVAHIAAITWECDVDPTFTTAPTQVGLNGIVANMKINDGHMVRFDGSFADLRAFEALELGRLQGPDADTNSASTNDFYYGRVWHPGPVGFEGNPSDFCLPVAALKTGVIHYTFGALTDISADTTAANVSVITTVWLLLMDEVRIPPAVERSAFSANSKDYQLAGKALYPFLALLDASTHADITAGDFGAITVIGAHGEIISGVDAETLGKAYLSQMLSGQFSPVQGEQRAATDDNLKQVNGGTPTALLASDAKIQPVLWCTPDARISKVVARSDASLRVKWNGSQASAHILATRILEQPESVLATMAAKAMDTLGRPLKGLKVKTISKKPYEGSFPEFMPYKAIS